jgi:hypothetical protein
MATTNLLIFKQKERSEGEIYEGFKYDTEREDLKNNFKN